MRDTGAAIDLVAAGVPLYVNSDSLQPTFLNPSGGNVGIGTTNPTNILTVVQGSATDPIADAWTTYSSRRWKQNIHPIDRALEKVEQLQGVYFDWKTSGRHDLGLVAEDVAQVVPQVVALESNERDAKSVDYGRLTALLVEAIKEQQREITNLKARLGELNKKFGTTE